MALGCTVRELLCRVDSRELTEWLAYWGLEPWGEERADLRQAITSTLIGNANLRKGRTPFKVTDFMLSEKGIGRKNRRQTSRQMHAAFLGWATAVNKSKDGLTEPEPKK